MCKMEKDEMLCYVLSRVCNLFDDFLHISMPTAYWTPKQTQESAEILKISFCCPSTMDRILQRCC